MSRLVYLLIQVVFLLTLFFIGLALSPFATLLQPDKLAAKATKIDTAPVEVQSSGRLQTQFQESTGSTYIQIICDTANGNLLYRTEGGLAIAINGCQKSPASPTRSPR